MVGENSSGQMDRYIKDNSKMIFDMEKVHIVIQVVKWVNLCGNKDKLIIECIQSKNSSTVVVI